MNSLSKAIVESKVSEKKVSLNPLQTEISAKKEPKRLIQITSIKDMLESMLRSYIHLTKKFNVYKKKKEVALIPRSIQCNSYHSTLTNPVYLDDLYKETQAITKETYKLAPKGIIKTLKKIMLEVGNECVNIIEYIDYFNDKLKKQTFLTEKDYHSPWLLLQVLSFRSKFKNSWGKFIQMGHYLGDLFAWVKIYSPKKNVLTKMLKKKKSLLNR